MDIWSFIQVTKKTRDYLKKNPQILRKREEAAYENRWRYFLMLPLFLLTTFGFLMLGYFFRHYFYAPIFYWIWMIFSGFLFTLGLVTWIHYGCLILRGRHEESEKCD